MEKTNIKQTEILLTIDNHEYIVELENNSSVDEFLELLNKGPISIEMHDYANMEKVGNLSQPLVQNNQPLNTSPGDIILYQGISIAIYYDHNSWSLTPIGKIKDFNIQEFKELTNKENVVSTFSLIP